MTANVISLRTYSNSITASQLDQLIAPMQQLGALPENFSHAQLLVPLPPGA